jgi:hypothetical protein
MTTIYEAIENNDMDELVFQSKNINVFGGFAIEHLEFACTQDCNIEIYKIILNNKVVPNVKCFINYIFYYKNNIKLEYDNMGFVKPIDIDSINVLCLLLNSGYQLSQTDFLLLTQCCIYVPNYKKYGLIIDDYIQHECKCKAFVPYSEIDIDEKLVSIAFKNNPTSVCLNKLYKKYKYNPTIDYICSYVDDQQKLSAMGPIPSILAKCKSICDNDIDKVIGSLNHFMTKVRNYTSSRKRWNTAENQTKKILSLVEKRKIELQSNKN